MSTVIRLLLPLIVYFSYKTVDCFNLDLNHALVYLDPESSINPGYSTYFGYTVELLKLNDSSRLHIGSPRSYDEEIRQPSGKFFKCNMEGPCEQIEIKDDSGMKDNQWLGVSTSVDLRNQKEVVCAHKWLWNYYLPGKCYWSHLNSAKYIPLNPLANSEQRIKFGAYFYPFGQAGFSLQFANTRENQTQLLMGAPGFYNWHGAMILYADMDGNPPLVSELRAGRKKRQQRQEGFTNFDILQFSDEPFSKAGYAVSSGYYFDRREINYVAGAPTDEDKGKIYVLTSRYNTRNSVVKKGTQTGEYFGASLASGDINNDGYDDLVIGAPYYKFEKYNEGRIVVYFGSNKSLLEIPSVGHTINGKAAGGQFGNTLAFLDDLDLDGYSEVAVSAPYENEGSGVVYIYKCTDKGLRVEPSQKIIGKDFLPTIRGFGISISKSIDIDDNNYKDLAIGAYKSGHVILLRARPTVILKHSLDLRVKDKININDTSFGMRYCLYYEGMFLPPKIRVRRTIVVDELLQRGTLADDFVSTAMVTLTRNSRFCENFTVNLDEEKKKRGNYDPVTVKLSQIFVDETTALPKNILTVVGRNLSMSDDSFCKNCPVYDKYRSYAPLTSLVFFSSGCRNDNICLSNIIVNAKFSNLTKESTFVIGSQKHLKLDVTLTNDEEAAFFTRILLKLPPKIKFRNTPSTCEEAKNETGTILCFVDNPLLKGNKKTLTFHLDMKEINSGLFDQEVVYINIKTLTNSRNPNENFTVPLRLIKEADVSIEGISGKQSYYLSLTDTAINFFQMFHIRKYGASPIDLVEFVFKIPYQLKERNFLKMYQPHSYLGEQPISCNSDVPYLEHAEETFDNIDDNQNDQTAETKSTTNENKPRRKRQTNDMSTIDKDNPPINNAQNSGQYPSNRTLYLNCTDTSEVKCATITCQAGPFFGRLHDAHVQFRMIFNSTNISALAKRKDIFIISTEAFVYIKLPKHFRQFENRPDNVTLETVFIKETEAESVPIWIIILSVILGLLLLILLIFGLIKAGFFKRSKKEELEALKKEDQVDHGANDANVTDANSDDHKLE